VEVIDPVTGEIGSAQIFVAMLPASSLSFAFASFSQKLPDWIEGQTRALSYFGGVPKSIVCDNLKSGVVKALWFEPTLNETFAALAEHYDTTILPTRSRKPRDKAKASYCILFG
jgi:transposase